MPATRGARKQPPQESAGGDAVSTQPARRRRPGGGRRRDPDIDARVLHAARQTYAEFGWVAFHFDRVAKSAQVSRDVLYRRYADKESLLLDALADAVLPTVSGNGPIRDQLMTYARDIYEYFTSADGVASLRIHLEANQFPELYRAYRSRVVDPNFDVNIAALDQAARNGELRKSADSLAILEAIGGGVLIHALYSQRAGATREAVPLSRNRLEATLRNFVDLALDDWARG
jgi:AcrR family transcriptional regulator